MSEFRLLFKWANVKADTREFRQDSDLLEVVRVEDVSESVYVAVGVPFESAYWVNYEEVAKNQLAGEKITPILSPEGMAYAKRKLEEPFRAEMKATEESDWADTVKTEKKLNGDASQAAWDTFDTSAPASTSTEATDDWGKAPWEAKAGEPSTEPWKGNDWSEEK